MRVKVYTVEGNSIEEPLNAIRAMVGDVEVVDVVILDPPTYVDLIREWDREDGQLAHLVAELRAHGFACDDLLEVARRGVAVLVD